VSIKQRMDSEYANSDTSTSKHCSCAIDDAQSYKVSTKPGQFSCVTDNVCVSESTLVKTCTDTLESTSQTLPPTNDNNVFINWLDSVQRRFQDLAESEKTQTLKGILKLCGPEQLRYLVQTYMPLSCFVDFFTFLPTDISYYILTFLDSESALQCCLVRNNLAIFCGTT